MELMDRMRDPELLKVMSLGDKLLGSLIVMILGIAICVTVLFIILLFIKILGRLSKNEKKKVSEIKLDQVETNALEPALQTDEDGEVVAAIVAAITIMQEGKPFYIRNIARSE